ncbi:MAG: hypothetical protein JWN52_4790, partial [Actinomycetia bacterium]|nr:hypothetical protein [Actinomycetes bacterium]
MEGPEPVVRGGTRLRRRPSPGRQARYDDEVRRLIEAAQTVMRRCGTAEAPRVADILHEAGLSNQAFYRHFRGRDDLVVATFEHGLITLFEYLSHQVAKEHTAEGRIRAWVSGVLVQLVDPELVELTRAIFWNVNRLPTGRSELEAANSERIRGLLVATLREGGS